MVGADVTVRPSFIITQAYGEKQSVHRAVRFEVEGRGFCPELSARGLCTVRGIVANQLWGYPVSRRSNQEEAVRGSPRRHAICGRGT